MVSTTEVAVENNQVEQIEIVNGQVVAPEDDFEKAQKKYQLGKKNLLLNKYDEAVNNIGDACQV